MPQISNSQNYDINFHSFLKTGSYQKSLDTLLIYVKILTYANKGLLKNAFILFFQKIMIFPVASTELAFFIK